MGFADLEIEEGSRRVGGEVGPSWGLKPEDSSSKKSSSVLFARGARYTSVYSADRSPPVGVFIISSSGGRIPPHPPGLSAIFSLLQM